MIGAKRCNRALLCGILHRPLHIFVLNRAEKITKRLFVIIKSYQKKKNKKKKQKNIFLF